MGCTSEKDCLDSSKSRNQYDSENIKNESQITISFRCHYDIKYLFDTQIMNNKYIIGEDVNEEILKKIKILKDGQKEELTLTKIFESKGINTVDFIIEEKLNNMSYMFYKCESLKKIEFICIDTSNVTNMNSMFEDCREL